MNEIAQNLPSVTEGFIQSDKKSITMGALVQVAYTLLSRVFGMMRDVMVSHIFGAGIYTDAFYIAFTIPNVLRQFFGEGAFSVAFVPVYVATKESTDVLCARAFFRDAFGLLLVSLGAITVLGILCSSVLVHVFAFGFSSDSEQFALANVMTKWLFPYVLMISVVALFGGYLACYQRFAAMAAAPIFLNLAQIIAMVFWINYFSPSIMVLTVGVLLGGFLQIALMITTLMRAGLWALPTFSIKTKAMRTFLRLLGPALFGIFVYQLNIIVLRQLASFLGEGQITYYYNADRLAQFATGVFAVSIATAALPELSRGVAKFGRATFYDTLRFTLTITSFIMTPCAFGLLVFAHPVIAVIFGHGAFNAHDAIITSYALMAFAPSIIAFGLSRPLIQAFYADGDTKTPVVVGVCTVLVNLSLGLILLRFNVAGLSLTLSISSFVQFFLLLYAFKRKSKGQFEAQLWRPLFAHVGISAIACGVGLIFAQMADWHQGFSIKNACVLMLLCASSASAYMAFAYYFRLPEARKFIDGIRSRLLSLN